MPGSVIVPILEGTRALLVELQALTTETSFAVPRRLATGLDTNRVLLLTAFLEKKIRFAMGKNDIYFNVVGGLKVDDRGMDLGICIALISSLYNVPIHKDTLLVGEVRLTGEVRGVYQLEKRIQKGAKLGFKKIIVSKNNKIKKNTYGIEVIPVETIQEAVSLFFKREE